MGGRPAAVQTSGVRAEPGTAGEPGGRGGSGLLVNPWVLLTPVACFPSVTHKERRGHMKWQP